MNLKTEGVPTAEALLGLLRIWTHSSSHGLSSRFAKLLTDPDVQEYLQLIVHELAVAWDGVVISAEGMRRLDLRLALDLRRANAWWVIPNTGSDVRDTLTGTSDGAAFEATISPDPHSSMFQTEALPPVTARALATGFRARGKVSVAEFPPAQLLAMTGDADAGGWMSVEAIQAYEEHVLVASPEISSAVETVLRAAADSGWRRISDRTAQKVVGSYAIFDMVSFSDQRSLDEAVQSLPTALASNLHLGSTPRPRLLHGLPLHRNLSRSTYLAGGEPDLELPVGAEPRHVLTTLDNKERQDFKATMFPIPLCRSGPYTPGEHTIEADGTELRFVVRSAPAEGYEPPGVGNLSWLCGKLTPTAEPIDLCGAWTENTDAEDPLLARRGAFENWLADRTGRLTQIEEPSPPDFAAGIPSMYFEVRGSDAAWLLQKRAKGWHAIRVRPCEPAFRTIAPGHNRVWREAVSSVRTDDWFWSLYVKAWRRIDER